jgi:hypothetical protein
MFSDAAPAKTVAEGVEESTELAQRHHKVALYVSERERALLDDEDKYFGDGSDDDDDDDDDGDDDGDGGDGVTGLVAARRLKARADEDQVNADSNGRSDDGPLGAGDPGLGDPGDLGLDDSPLLPSRRAKRRRSRATQSPPPSPLPSPPGSDGAPENDGDDGDGDNGDDDNDNGDGDGDSPIMRGPAAESDVPSMSQVDPAVIDSLPPEIVRELHAAWRAKAARERQMRASGGTAASSSSSSSAAPGSPSRRRWGFIASVVFKC